MGVVAPSETASVLIGYLPLNLGVLDRADDPCGHVQSTELRRQHDPSIFLQTVRSAYHYPRILVRPVLLRRGVIAPRAIQMHVYTGLAL